MTLKNPLYVTLLLFSDILVYVYYKNVLKVHCFLNLFYFFYVSITVECPSNEALCEWVKCEFNNLYLSQDEDELIYTLQIKLMHVHELQI